MASVQVRILQSGRADAYGLPLAPGSVVTVDRDYAVSLVYAGFASWMNPADSYDGETNLRKSSEDYTLLQLGIPFWVPPGDGGSNGLIFAGTNGEFTLSAAAPIAGLGTTVLAGCYIYLPAGSGGLITGGWYWCVMTSDTAGKVFSEMYSGVGNPPYVSSPTDLPNLTATRITQTTDEIVAVSFTLPGKSMGPNGLFVFKEKYYTSSTAGAKSIRVRVGSTQVFQMGTTTAYNNQQFTYTRQNMGVENRQIGPKSASATAINWDCHGTTSTYGTDLTTINTAIDQTVTFTSQLTANTDSTVVIPMQFTVQYGA